MPLLSLLSLLARHRYFFLPATPIYPAWDLKTNLHCLLPMYKHQEHTFCEKNAALGYNPVVLAYKNLFLCNPIVFGGHSTGESNTTFEANLVG